MHKMDAHKSYDSSSLLHFEANTFTLQDLGSSCWYVDWGIQGRQQCSRHAFENVIIICVHGAHKHTCIIHTKMHAVHWIHSPLRLSISVFILRDLQNLQN